MVAIISGFPRHLLIVRFYALEKTIMEIFTLLQYDIGKNFFVFLCNK